jgi:hypothetical protein
LCKLECFIALKDLINEHQLKMGRRAKNKQGDPQALFVGKVTKETPKKLGKRKADADVDVNMDDQGTRATKKFKATLEKAGRKGKKDTKKPAAANGQIGRSREREQKPSEVVVLNRSRQEDESEGWEDVEEGAEFENRPRFVLLSCEVSRPRASVISKQ